MAAPILSIYRVMEFSLELFILRLFSAESPVQNLFVFSYDLQKLEGLKYVLLLHSNRTTFSKHTWTNICPFIRSSGLTSFNPRRKTIELHSAGGSYFKWWIYDVVSPFIDQLNNRIGMGGMQDWQARLHARFSGRNTRQL